MKQPLQYDLKSGKSSGTSKKFLMHFESINTPVKIPNNFANSHPIASDKNKFHTALQMYTGFQSLIDKIADQPVKQSEIVSINSHTEDFISAPIVIPNNPKVKERVQSINQFFNRVRNKKSNRDDNFQHSNQQSTLNGYIQSILDINIENNRQSIYQNSRKRSNSRSKSKQSAGMKTTERKPVPQSPAPLKTPQRQQTSEVEVNTDPIQSNQRPTNKLKKADLLMVQIMREKKRKGLMPDYYRAIQMKLIQFLEYILHDEDGYLGLPLKEKMKDILQNLQSFKGKTIDGESKINMLRIFFQEFRNLKKQREEEQENQRKKSKSNSKKAVSNNQSKGESSPYPQYFKASKNYETMSMGRPRQIPKPSNKKNPSSKSVKEEDQWMGTIDQ